MRIYTIRMCIRLLAWLHGFSSANPACGFIGSWVLVYIHAYSGRSMHITVWLMWHCRLVVSRGCQSWVQNQQWEFMSGESVLYSLPPFAMANPLFIFRPAGTLSYIHKLMNLNWSGFEMSYTSLKTRIQDPFEEEKNNKKEPFWPVNVWFSISICLLFQHSFTCLSIP